MNRPTSRRGRPAGLLLALLLLLVIAPSASAGSGWLDPVTLDSSGDVRGPKVAVSPAGDAIAVWTDVDTKGTPAGGDDVRVVLSAFRPAGGTFSAPKVISNNADGVFDADVPSVGMDAAGNAVVIWVADVDATGATSVPRVRSRAISDGSWGTVRNLATPVANHAVAKTENQFYTRSPALAMNADGRATVIWATDTGGGSEVHGATGRVLGSFTTLPGQLNNQVGLVYRPSVAIDAAGNSIFAWEIDLPDRWNTQTRWLTAGGAVEPAPVTQSSDVAGHHAANPQVAMAPDGRATLVWSDQQDSGGGTETVQIKYRTRSAPATWANGSWSVEDTVGLPQSPATNIYTLPSVVMTGDNTAVAIWPSQSDKKVHAASKLSGASFSGDQILSQPGSEIYAPHLSANSRGDVLAIFPSTIGSDASVQAALRPAGASSFGPTTEDLDVAEATGGASGDFPSPYPQVALDDEGNAIGGWLRKLCPAGGCTEVYEARYAGFDAAPPRLRDVRIPGSGNTGAPVSFSVSPLDVWSASNVRWDFGDGTSADGPSVEHVYGAPGPYTARVTATDPFGNASSTTGVVTVTTLVVDDDKDGSPLGEDCDDKDPARFPLATEVPNDGIDQDCRDGDPRARVQSTVRNVWRAYKKYTEVITLQLKNVPAGAKVRITCKSKRKGCPFKKRTLTFEKTKKSKSITKYFNRKKKGSKKKKVAKLRVGTKVKVAFAAPQLIGRSFKYTVRKSKVPKTKEGCLVVNGGFKAQKC